MASPHGFGGLGTVPPPRPVEQRGSRLSLPGPSQPLLPSLSEGLAAAAPLVTRSFSRAHFGEASQSPTANAGDRGVEGWTPGWEPPRGGHGNPGIPPRYSCRENPMDTGAWWVTVPGVIESETMEVT